MIGINSALTLEIRDVEVNDNKADITINITPNTILQITILVNVTNQSGESESEVALYPTRKQAMLLSEFLGLAKHLPDTE